MEISRRSFLISTACSGAAVVLQPTKKFVDRLIPYISPPQETQPGVWSLFSTTCRECPAGCGMHVRHIDGRAVKTEGNPDHPINHGALCARGQSSVQGLYDPDRIPGVLRRAAGAPPQPSDWATALKTIGDHLRESEGRVVVMSDLQTGALAEIMQQFAKAFGSDRVLFFEPFNYEALKQAHGQVFGLPVIPDYRLESCDFILSLSADFLETWISPVQFAREFAAAHAYVGGKRGRLAYVGPRLSMTAANADEFLKVRPGMERWVALAMLKIIVDRGWGKRDVDGLAELLRPVDLKGVESDTGVPSARIESLAKAFADAKGSVALAGPAGAVGRAAVDTAVAAALLNAAAGRIGQTVDFSRSHALGKTASREEQEQCLSGLTGDDIVIIHGANPVYALPGARAHIRRARMVVYLGTLMDETAENAAWFLPVDSPLESWGDHEPCAGVQGLMQPAMSRIHDTRPAGDVFLGLAQAAGKPLAREDAPAGNFEEWLHARWRQRAAEWAPGRPSEPFWTDCVRRGGYWEERALAAPEIKVQLAGLSLPVPPVSDSAMMSMGPDSFSHLDLWAWSSVMLFDGRGANRGWLQEAPDPVSSVVWRNWVDLHPFTAGALGLKTGDIVELQSPFGNVRAPVRVTDDVAAGVAAVAFGQGHAALGRNATDRGANAFSLLGQASTGSTFGAVTARRTGERFEPVSPCATQDQQHREIVQWTGLAAVSALHPGEGGPMVMPLPEGYDPKRDLYSPHAYPNHRWAMAVDLDRCTGCGACAVACYAENNLAVVGEEQVRRGREMAWLRVVPYRDDAQRDRLGFLPLMCQHCDAAPCEPVCPVFASVHSDEGLNAQVYNRCIGTRYCSHNCPYKVRRFNWRDAEWPTPLDRQLNPDVTVRCRGVMEKCTFCIQRIREVEHRAKREGRPVRDGEVKPACVQTCPTGALVFGDLMDPQAKVTETTRRDPRRYHVLEELNTKPAVAYLRRVTDDQDASH